MSEILNVFIAAKLEQWWTKSLVKMISILIVNVVIRPSVTS